MNTHHLHIVLQRFRMSFLAAFPKLTDQDIRIILEGPSETLLIVLQGCYGYTREQAKAAWNNFVLHSIDGVYPSMQKIPCSIVSPPSSSAPTPSYRSLKFL